MVSEARSDRVEALILPWSGCPRPEERRVCGLCLSQLATIIWALAEAEDQGATRIDEGVERLADSPD